MPAMNPSAGSAGVLGVLVLTSSPVSSSTATTSVKVPPVSMPTLIRRRACAMPSIQPGSGGRFVGSLCRRSGAAPANLATVDVPGPARQSGGGPAPNHLVTAGKGPFVPGP